jgi:hypothetical protein
MFQIVSTCIGSGDIWKTCVSASLKIWLGVRENAWNKNYKLPRLFGDFWSLLSNFIILSRHLYNLFPTIQGSFLSPFHHLFITFFSLPTHLPQYPSPSCSVYLLSVGIYLLSVGTYFLPVFIYSSCTWCLPRISCHLPLLGVAYVAVYQWVASHVLQELVGLQEIHPNDGEEKSARKNCCLKVRPPKGSRSCTWWLPLISWHLTHFSWCLPLIGWHLPLVGVTSVAVY